MMSKSYFYLTLICLGLQLGSLPPPVHAEVIQENSGVEEEDVRLTHENIEDNQGEWTVAAHSSSEVLADAPLELTHSGENTPSQANVWAMDVSADLLIPTDAIDAIHLAQLDPVLTDNSAATEQSPENNPEATIALEAESVQTSPTAPTIDPLAQATPVSQLRDIDGRHWAAQALRQLSQRYNCLPSYFSADAVLTRYEFADILYNCMEVVNQAILDSTAENVSQEDLAIAQRLQEEFQSELAELSLRVDSLEEQIQTLEDQQFVKRTTLFGIAEFLAFDTFGDSLASQPGRQPTVTPGNVNTTFSTGNLFLDIDAKVRGKDFVRVELLATNALFNNRTATNTDMTRVDTLPPTLDFRLNYLFYQMKFAKTGVLRVGPVGLIANHIIPDLSPTQSPSRFGRRNPIYRPVPGAGFLANYQVNDWFGVGAGYTVGGTDPETPAVGFFNGQNRFIAQTTFTPSPKLGLGVTYSHVFQKDGVSITGFTGSRNAQAPFGDGTDTSAHLFSVSGNYRVNKRFGIGGWVGYANARAEANTIIPATAPQGDTTVERGDKADLWNWAVGMTVADVGRKGNELGFLFGMPFKAVRNDFQPFEDDQETSYHAEMYYVYRVNPRISITPGLYAIFNPEHDSSNNTLVVGLIRTAMRF